MKPRAASTVAVESTSSTACFSANTEFAVSDGEKPCRARLRDSSASSARASPKLSALAARFPVDSPSTTACSSGPSSDWSSTAVMRPREDVVTISTQRARIAC